MSHRSSEPSEPSEPSELSEPHSITEALEALTDGEPEAEAQLLERVYEELRRQAGRMMHGERTGHTLQPTALVHEAYLRLARQRSLRFESRGHFFGAAARIMRRVLVDHARARGSDKRGGDRVLLPLDPLEEVAAAAPAPASAVEDVLAVDRALEELESFDGELAMLVELRFFGGLTVAETAETLGVSVPTAVRRWRLARAWLHDRLGPGPEPGSGAGSGAGAGAGAGDEG